MSHPTRHHAHHRGRDDNAAQRRIIDRITEVQGKQHHRRRHINEDAVVIHQEPDFRSLDSKADWDEVPARGAPIGRLVQLPSRAMGSDESEDSGLAHYDMHPLLDQNHLRRDHFYENKRSDSNSQRAKPASARAQSLPPVMEGRRRVGANFPGSAENQAFETESTSSRNNISKSEQESEEAINKYEDKMGRNEGGPPAERRSSGSSNGSKGNNDPSPNHVEQNDSVEEFKFSSYRNDDLSEHRMDDRDASQEFPGGGDDYNQSVGKKVSYSLELSDHPFPISQSPRAVPCRLRAECVEKESEMNLEILNRGRVQENFLGKTNSRNFLNSPSFCKSSDSILVMEDSGANKANNNNNTNANGSREGSSASTASMRYSHQSMGGMGRKASNLYAKEVLPLPIEIPDSVADAEAFRRYLSKEPSSYDSLGRGNGARAALGVTPSQRLNQDASRRTASLSHAIMTLALLSASICQLRFLITYSHAHSYPVLNYFLIFTSIVLEVGAGIGYVMIARCNYDDAQAEAFHNYLIFALFIVAVSNVVLAAFAFDDHVCDDIIQKSNNPNVAANSQQNQQINQPMPREDRVMDLRYMPLE